VTVYLVGAGPGDPGLLTVRGAEVLRRADVVIYDRLSVAALLDLAPRAAERISVGKAPRVPGPTQEDINDLLVEHGRTGRTVVRLKGGDPFVFARGGEEAEALAVAGIDYEVVPGITSAIAVPAYAGIPVTMRHSSTLFTVITGHEEPDKADEIDWDTVAKLGGTIVVLMGIGRLPRIVERLRAGGLPGDTPVAVVQWGTRPEQRTVRATLATVLDHELAAPSTIVIGKVAALDLNWFEQRPLFGRTVVVTRAAEQAPVLVDRLRARGAETLLVPTIEIGEPADGGAGLRAAAAACAAGAYEWVVLTSTNGADRFLRELRDGRDLGGVRIAAIGSATADAIAAHHLVADLVPPAFVAESLVDVFPAPTGEGTGRVLLARAATAREVLPDGLRAKGWAVDVVEAYRTHRTEIDEEVRMSVLDADVITFTSSSTVDNYVRSMHTVETPPVVACIGPITCETARGHGIHVDVEADEHTIDGLVAAIEAHFDR
jgi:uroporphyrinogen III methyltransferase/synthase